MSASTYQNQARLLIDVLPMVAEASCFALHGGTAINLFVRDMPRLSVDIDLTYVPIEDRETTSTNIDIALRTIQRRVDIQMPNTRAVLNSERAKLLISRQAAQIKVEVNTIMRGVLGEPISMVLCQQAQEKFDRFAELRIVPIGQLYGGKICAALDRQHPRDLFDVKYLFENDGVTAEIKRGFLLCLLCSDRPIHEIIRPRLQDQRATLNNHFAGMTDKPFTYEMYEETRHNLIEQIVGAIDELDRRFLISFAEGSPKWTDYGFTDFEPFPAIQWKLQNLLRLKSTNPAKHQKQLAELEGILYD
jgi:predicted nucleotidyltransferase component of viral defense system